jgi:hypothetical protein
MRDQDDFFGLGSLQVDGKYHGRNWNGSILVIVRRILRDEIAADTSSSASTLGDSTPRFPSEPFPPLLDDDDEQQSRPHHAPLSLTGAKDPLLWSGTESDPHVSKPSFRVESAKSLFVRPQSAVFTVKSDICLWAGQNRAKKLIFGEP